MNVFVTGGTGFVGREIVRQLHTAGHPIRILVRGPASRQVQEWVSRGLVETYRGDLFAADSLAGGLKDVNAVIHLVGIISEIRHQTFENVHTHGTENVVAAALRAGVKRFVHMSALGTRPNAQARYHQSKWAAEECVRRSGLDWTIFRPSIIYGPGDGFVNLFARMSRMSPVLPVMGSGRTKFQPIAVEDVGACFVKALEQPQSVGQTLDLCGQEAFTLEEIIDLILEITRRKRFKAHLPFWLVRAQAACLEFVFPRLLGRAPPLNRDQVLMLQEDNIGDADGARELFGLDPGRFRQKITDFLGTV